MLDLLAAARGFNAISGQNGISMNPNDTEVRGPITFLGSITASKIYVAGDVTGGGFAAFFDSYSVASLGKKENMITVSSPLLKTAANGLNQLSLDTAAAYTLGTLYVRGATNLHTSSCGDVAIIDSTGADVLRVTDDGYINISAAHMKLSPTSAGGLILLSNISGPSI